MKNICNLTLLLILSLALQGCFSMQDEVWIEADGSGRMEATTDMSSLYPFMMMGLQEELNKDKDGDGKSEDSEASDPFTGMMKDLMLAEEVDTTFRFQDMLNSTLAEEGMSWDQMLDSLRNAPDDGEVSDEQKDALIGMFEEFSDMRIRMQASQTNQVFKTTSIQDFSALDELTSMGSVMTEMMSLMAEEEGGGAAFGPGGEADAMISQFADAQTNFDLDGNTLRVRRAGLDMSFMGEEFEQNFAMIKMFLGNDPYRLVIHFPGKVRKISSDVAEKIDRNTVAIEIPLDDLFDPEKRTDVEIQFKGLRKR